MKLIIAIIFILTSLLTYGQNKHFTIGTKENGVCFGNSKANSGIRLNFIDKNVNQLNGINLSIVTKSKIANGFTFGLIANQDSISNGILVNGLVGESYKANGIVVSGLGYGADRINGVGIGGIALAGDTLNGLFLSGIGVAYWNTQKIKLINGVTFGFIIGTATEKMNGLSLSLIQNVCDTLNGVAVSLVNKSKELHGVQFGLWNVAENNRILKQMPIMNFNFRRSPSR